MSELALGIIKALTEGKAGVKKAKLTVIAVEQPILKLVG